MNAIYKVIWNDAIRQYQVVNELCRSRRKACSVKAVHTETASGSHSVVSSLKRGAVIIGSTLTLLATGTTVWADDYVFNENQNFVWNLGAGTIESQIVTDIARLPQVGTQDRIIINLGNIDFNEETSLVYQQDEDQAAYQPLISVPVDYIDDWNWQVPVIFQDAQGNTTNQVTRDTGFAKFTYLLEASASRPTSTEGTIAVRRKLTQIELTSSDNWQYLDAGERNDTDLSAKITGNGNVTFGFSATAGGDATEGWLTLNSDTASEYEKSNDYTGQTKVGYTAQGASSDVTHLVFGMTEALGNTSMLDVDSRSEVRFGGMDGDKAYTQTVGGLSGAGTLALGSAAKLTLEQSEVKGVTTAPEVDEDNNILEPGKIGILNNITGTGAADPQSGAVFNVNLSGKVEGYEVVFTDQHVNETEGVVDFSGLITLQNSSVTAYREGRGDTVGGTEYADVNKILTGSMLALNNNAWLRIDETGEVHDLNISSSAGGLEYSSIAGLDDDEFALTITGDLTLNGNANVYIKDFDFESLKGEAESKSLLSADNGYLTHLLKVEDTSNTNNYSFTLDTRNQQKIQTSDIKQNNDVVAQGTWELEKTLRDNRDGTFDLVYTLTKVDVSGGQTLELTGEANATEEQDFIAQITDSNGAGNIVFSAGSGATGSGTFINVGYQSGSGADAVYNDYSGKTTVTDGTTVKLIKDSGFGDTSELLAQGNVTLSEGIKQTIHGIDSTGSGTITLSSGSELTLDANGSQTINNIIAGSGSLVVDLADSGNGLVFNNSGQGESFTGNMTLSNGRFSMSDGSNASFAANAGIVLGSGSTFDLGSGSQNIKDLTVNTASKLESSALVIGSQKPAHTISGSLTLNANTSLTLNDISVADDLSLVDYDGSTHVQQFISAGTVSGTGSIAISGGQRYPTLGSVMLNYSQGSNVVAETVWSIGNSLTQSGSGLDVNVELSEIKLIDNTVISGSGTDNELSALISNSTRNGSHSLQFSLADGATSADFLVNHANGNTYSGSTTVDFGVSVTLGVNSGFGNTSNLTVAEGGTVKLNEGVSQVVGGLSGAGTVDLAGTGSVLTLTQNESAAIGNLLSGNGTFEVNLGGSGNQLSFTNSGSSGFAGTVDLSSGFLVLEGATTTQSVMDGASLVLGNSGVLKVEGTASYQAQIGSLSLDNGSRLELGAVNFGEAADRPQLLVSNGMTISGSVTLSVGGINLDGTTDILTANSTGLSQALVTANGGITNNGTLAIVADDLDVSEIRNSGSIDVAAYGVWTPQGNNGVVIDESTIYASLKLNEIQLALDNDEGLLLDLTGQTSASLDAKLTNYQQTAGDITFSGAGSITLTNSGNEFTGSVYVESDADVTLGTDNVLGSSDEHTSLLDITGEGSQVNLNGTKQYVGSINATVDGALTGSGSLTIDGADQQSTITGSNTGLSADITLSSGHTLSINNVASIGTSGILTVADKTKLQISGASEGTFTKQLTGGGDIFVDASTFTVSGANSGFTGTWHIAEHAQTASVTVSGTTAQIDASIGSGATVALGSSGGMSLIFSETNGTLTIDDVFTGAGQLTVSGTTGAEEFGFATEWNQQPGFSGTLALNHIGMQVGGADGSVAANNASNLSNADLILNNSTVTVNGNVDTFDRVTVAAGSSGTFTLGGLGFSAPDSTIAGISQLSVGSLDLNAGQTLRIQVSAPAANGDLLGSVAQTNLISGGMSPFQTLISTDKGITINGGTVELVDAAGNAVADDIRFSQQINNAEGTTTVASGYYSIEPGVTNNDLALGIGYTLERIDILSTLTLSEEGTVEAQITSNSTSGNLTIASGGNITLTNSGNEFTGDTTIASGGRLVAHEKALGKTDDLVVSGKYVNSGANAVNRVEVDGSGQLTLNADLTLENSGAGTVSSTISGAITGKGNLAVEQGTLLITENAGSSDYAGAVVLGTTGSTDAMLVLNGADGLGSGSIVFNTEDSLVQINDASNVLFSNAMTGQGVISVNLSGTGTEIYEFAFKSTQDELASGSSLILDKANFDLTASDVNVNDNVAQKFIITVNQGSTLSNDGTANKTIAGLKLYGGTVDMGVLESGTGQISLNNGTLTIDQGTTNTIVLDSQAQTSESGDRTISSGGQELLAGGLFDLTIFENVASVSGSDGSNVLGTSDADGNQSVSGLVTNSGFSGTSENLFQDADDDGTEDFVATMTRDSGSFFYNANSGNVFLQYSFKEINLLWTDLAQGLTIDATGRENAALSAHVTGGGNLRLGGTLTISGSSSDNDYIGRTYVLKGASVTVAQDSGFGVTKELNIADGAVVTMSNNVSQTVASLTGTRSGTLTLGDNAAFTIDNGLYADSKLSSIDIGTTISGGSGATFAIDGDGVAVNFATQSNLSGATFKLLDAQFAIADSKSLNYLTSASSNDFVLGSGADVMVTAGDTPYKYNELTFAGGELSVNGVMLASGSTGAIIHTEFLDLSQNSTLSVSADIDENFDILVNDSDSYSSTLIAFDDLSEKGQLATPISGYATSSIDRNNDDVAEAYVGWSGQVVWSFEDELNRSGSGSVGIEYQVQNLQLALDSGAGLVVSTTHSGAATEQSTLTATITDYQDTAGHITFSGGDITIGGTGTNDYRGETFIDSGKVTLAKNSGFGQTEKLTIEGGGVDIAGFSQTLGALSVDSDASISGGGNLTLGSAAYSGTSSTVSGANSNLTGTVYLRNGHTLTMNEAEGLGASGAFDFGYNTTVRVSGDANSADTHGNFSKTLTGDNGTVVFDNSTYINITGNNSEYGGSWVLQNGSTVFVSGNETLNVDAILGNGGTVRLSGTSDILQITQSGGAISLDNVFAGSGRLEVLGTGTADAKQSFGFSKDWAEPNDFDGTLAMSGFLDMTVGGDSSSVGAYNAANLAYAGIVLGADSTVTVAQQNTVVNTFDQLAVNGGTLSFGGTFGLGASTSELGQLQVGSLSGSGDIALSIPSGSQAVAQTIDQNDLINIDASGDDLFQALVTVESGTASADRWTLNGREMTSGSGLRQAVNGDASTTTVAYAKYDYQLTTGDVSGVGSGTDNALGIGYDLTAVDIVSGQTLTLSTSGSLGAIIENSSGHGNLAITGQIVLTSENTYSGETRVSGENAKLTVGVSGLGETSVLKLSSDAEFVNSGANAVGYLTASDADMTLDAALTVKGTSGSTIDGGTLNGTGALNLVIGGLTVTDNVGGNYSGLITLGDSGKDTNAELTLSGTAGLGTGMVAFATSNSKVAVNGSASTTLANTYSGNGVIDVDLGASDSVFAFNGAQGTDSAVFTGELRLSNATYNLYAEGEKLAGATLTTENNAVININTTDSVGDRNIGSLHLNGGQINFGELAFGSDSGQIVISKTGDFGIRTDGSESNTVINVSLADNTEASAESVFDANADKSILLIQDFDAQRANLTGLSLGNSKTLTQDVIQTGRGADNDQTAVLTYASGALTGTEQGIEAGWKLTQIELTDASGKGMLINASGESGGSGSISALISGAGNIEFGGGTIKLDHANTYEGQTTVSNNATLELGQSEALGNTSLLNITSGTVAVNATQQTIGSLQTTVEGAITMVRGGRLELAGNSSVSGANSGIESGSTIALATGSETLTINDAESLGLADISLGNGTTLLLSGIASGSSAATFDNAVSGASGTVALNGGALVEFTSTANGFGTLHVYGKGTTAVVNDMQENVTALGNALVNVDSGSRAELNGSDDWTLDNALAIAEGGELALSAGGSGNAFNFSGSNQTINGRVTLTDLMLTLDGHNEEVLDTASVVAGSNSHVHVALGNVADDRQQVKDFTLSSGAEITFDGQLGMSGVGANVLGQMDVSGTLTLDSGSTVHVSVDPNTGASSTVAQDRLVETAASGSFQNLITAGTIDGSAVSDNGTVIGIGLTDSRGNALQTVRAAIKNGNDTVAVGTFGSSLLVSGSSFGVRYGLQAIDILGDLTISESGSFSAKISSTGRTGSLTVSADENLTLSGENDYTVATTVTGMLTADKKALGNTKSLTISNGGQFINAGANEVGDLESSGKMTLNALLTVTNALDGESHVSGTLAGNGDLMINSGSLVSTAVSDPTSGYAGTVTLGTSDTDAHLTLEADAGAQIGSGTIEFANADSSLTINTSGASVLGNLLSGVGQVTVSGTNGESFAFKAGQEKSVFTGALTLTNVEYDFTTDANDILDDVSLTVNNGTTLVLNDADDTATRKIKGLSLNGGRIDFGTIGNGSGHIDLQGQSLLTSDVDTTLSLETDLADRQDASGSAAFDTVIDDSVLLIGNIAAATPESVLDGLAFADNGQAFTRDLTQGTETTARIHGKLGGLVLAGNDDGTKNIEAGLVNESLELLTTYNVRDSGSITLKIFGSGSLAVYNELKLTNGANSYKGDTTVFGAGAVLTLGADGALGQADSHTGELSVTDGAKVDFGSTSQTIGSITAEGTDALVSADQTNGKLTIADGGTVSGVNSGFHTAVELSDGSAGLTLTNVDALGQASITTLGSNTDLVLSGADGEFDNIVAGSGGLSIVNGANVTLTGENTFAGTLTVDSDSSVAASGDVFLHIVGGSLELEGSADFTQTTFADEHSVWKWNRTVNGSGNLSLSTDGAHELVLESGLGNFKGNLTLGNLQMTLSSGGNIMQSLAALSGSKIKSLILDADADLHLEGATTLSTGADNFGVTMKSGGSFVFEGIAVPGSEETATNTTHLTIDGNLTLEKGFELSLSTEEDAKVDPTNGKSLLEQDDDGMSISVITAHNIALDGFKDINDGGSVTLDGGRDTIFEIVDGDGNVVADGHYAFEIGLTDETDSDTLNLSYKLDQVTIRGGQELELAGGNDGSAVENTLSAKLSGSGNLSIKSGVVTLANSNNDFTGATTVQSEAVLYAESGALGSDSGAATSILTVAEKASAYIEGNNTVDGLMVSRGEGEETTGVLHIGASDDNVTLTLRSSTSETDPANHIYGTLSGAGTLRVLGNGQVHEGVDPDLTIHSSQERFDGDVQLESGAWVKIDADKSNLFGNSLVHTKISIDKGSLLTIESRYDGEGSFAGIFTNGANDLGGTVEIKLLNASDLFRFTTDQDTAQFNGTFVLDQGTIDYTRLYSSASGGNNAVLADATLQLNDNGNLKLFDTDETGNGSTSDVNLGGLTLDGGNIAFGSINYDAGHESAVSGAHAMHINLGGDGVLALNDDDGRTSTVTISQNETNNISAGGSELLAADDGTSIVLIHNIGSLEINGKNVTGEYANGASIGSDYLQLQNEAGETQLLAQQLGGSGDYVDVAEVVRTFDDELTFGQSTINGENGKYAVSLGYTVDRVGLLHQTGAVSADDFTDETVDNSLWQGLTITASDSEDPKRNEFSALITDGSNGEAGNLVLRGNETARDAVLTITGPENDAGEFTGNTYTGKTWVTAGANIALGANSAFGSTQALRVDSGSTVDFGIYDQTVGGLFALGDEALQSDEGSLITVKEDAVIRGSNTNLFGNITFEGDAEINNAVGLGTGTVTLAGNGSQLEINGASGAAGGEFANTLVGGENTSVQMIGSDIALGTDQLENYKGSFNLIESELDLSIIPAESDETVLGNVITTDVNSTLLASLGDSTKNFIFAEGSKIAGTLAISNGAFNLSDERNLSAFDKTDLVIGDAGRLEIASDIGAEDVDNLTLDKDSTIAFSGGGTPGSAGYDDSKGHLDLGDGTLTVKGNVGVEVDVGMVNADLVEDAMHDVSNLPLTAQDVLTADQGGQILANLVEAGNVVNDEGSFKLTVTGGEYDSAHSSLKVGIFNDGNTDEVAKGIYDYTVRLTEGGLNLSYGLTGVELIRDKTLSLKGYAETDDIDNTLSIAVTGDGSLSIDAGTITLTGQNGYKGSTTVAGGATLVTGIGGKALGETSSLNLKDTADGLVGARAEIHGDETVGALNIDAKSTLALGAAAENDRTEFTIKNTAGVESTVNGQITGGRDSLITVIGNADSNDHDFVVTSANNNFYGDVTLQDAYVRLESINSFGSEGILRLDTTSTLEINSNADDAQTVTGDDGTVYTYHKFENLISGDGTVRVALDDADDYFDFAEDQYKYPSGDDQAFTGTLELAVGKFRFTDRKADVLESVHVKLDGDATLDISSDTSETTDRTMRGLTLAGGTLEFGSLALDREHAEARATHINLDGNDLNLEDADRQVEISFRQNATNYISDAGSEVVNAADGDGSKIVLIHGIGNLHVDGETLATSENAQAVLQDYLKHEFADNAEDQILHQSIAGAGHEADVQQVARVDREFGDFGYADMSDQNLGNALYLGYEINSIELLYRGSNDEAYGADGVWKGLTVSTSDLSNQLKAQLTGQGNLVVTGGTGGMLLIGDASTETEYNNYTGRTWVTGNAKVEFAEDNAFGNTSHLRVDVGSSVNLGGDESGGGFSQTVGSLVTYDENALIGGKDASLTVTGSAQIAGNNSGFYGNLIFDTEQVTTGTVTDVEGLGQGNVYIGENYQLQITDIADADGGSILLENDIFDVNGKGGLLQIGSGLSKPEHESTTIIAGNNSNFSGNIRVEDGWAISAEVGEGEDIADRLGTGSLTLAGDASATIDFGSSDVEWNHNVDGRGTLNVATDADKTVSIGSGLGSGFEGTFTVGGGRFELADNADKLGNGNLAASGGNASIIVSDDGPVEFGNNLTITGSNEDRGQLVFEDSIKLSDNGSPELIVDGNLTLKGADVSVSVDGELEAGQGPNEPLDMSSITMADEGSIDYVIAKAGLIDMSDTTLSIETDGSGNAMTVDITDGGKKVATGKYDFGLSVSTDRTELGLSYRLVEVEIDDADTLLGLQGAVSGSTSAADWANASEFSAKITGAGGISLVNGNLTLTGAENTYHGATVVYDGAVLTVESSLGNTSLVTVAEGGRLVNASDSTKAGAVNVAGRLDLQAGSKLSLKEGGESSITGSITGRGELELLSNASVAVTAGSGYEAFTGAVKMEEGAEYVLNASNGSTVIVGNSFADGKNSAGGTVRFDKASGSSSANYSLAGSAVGFTGTFELGDNVVVSANSIEAIGGKGSELLITTGKVGDEIDKATLSFEYDDELVGQNDSLRITQGMTEGITFEKSGDGVVDLSDNAMGAGKVDVKEGGVLFGTSDRKSAYDTALEIAEDAWAAGFGGVSSLKVDLGGSFYVGGRSGYNSVFASTATKAANEDPANTPPAADNTVDFVVNGSVTNAGTIYVGNKNADGSAPADSSSIGNELVIKGDYNVTASDKDGVGTGGIFDMNAIIAGDDSIADHVTITGKINGNGYVDVNYDSTVSTGGTLEYLGLVKVEGGDDGESLWLKDEVKIGDLWYRLMWSSEQNEYYLQSSVTDPGDKPWDTEDVENVNAGTRSALAFMQAQAFDLSLRGHLGETLYVDPVTGEQRKSSFWMIQRGDWTKFSNASGQMDADGNLYTTHLGTDLFKRETDGATFRWGVLAGFADGDFDVSSNVDGKTSKGSFRGYSAGLYMTAESKAESGPFLGLQLRWNRFDSEVGQDDYDVNGLSLTAEASWDQLLSKGITDGGRNYEWRLEPHVRAYWTNFGDPDDWTSSLGETYSSDFDNGLLVRVGARTKIQTTLGTGPAWQAYAEANWVYNNGDYSTTMSTKYGDVTSTQNGAEFAEFRLGLEAQFTTNVNV